MHLYNILSLNIFLPIAREDIWKVKHCYPFLKIEKLRCRTEECLPQYHTACLCQSREDLGVFTVGRCSVEHPVHPGWCTSSSQPCSTFLSSSMVCCTRFPARNPKGADPEPHKLLTCLTVKP